MATAREVIQVALRYIGKDTDFKQATDSDYNLMLPVLNRMLSTWFRLGLRLAVSKENIPSLDSPVPYPDFAIEGIQWNLAEKGWNLFKLKEPLNFNVKMMAEETKSELWSIGRPVPESVFPGVLPIGSGNEWDTNSTWQDPFYPDCDDNIYTCNKDELTAPSGVPLKGVDND